MSTATGPTGHTRQRIEMLPVERAREEIDSGVRLIDVREQNEWDESHLEAATHVPQAELFSYATELRSLAQGRGSFSATLDHYEDVPSHLADKVIETHRKELEAAGGHSGGH